MKYRNISTSGLEAIAVPTALQAVWPEKNCQISKKLPKMISLEKWMILTPLQKLPKNGEDWGKLIVATGFERLPKSPKYWPIWSHGTASKTRPSVWMGARTGSKTGSVLFGVNVSLSRERQRGFLTAPSRLSYIQICQCFLSLSHTRTCSIFLSFFCAALNLFFAHHVTTVHTAAVAVALKILFRGHLIGGSTNCIQNSKQRLVNDAIIIRRGK